MSHNKHFSAAARFSLTELKTALKEAEGFNAKLAVFITKSVGTMACAYLFCLLALTSLPENLIQAKVLPESAVPHILANPGLILLVAWLAQTFFQLVLLSIILVGQGVQSRQAEEHVETILKDTETLLDRMDSKTAGGISDVLAAIHELDK